MTLRRHTMLLLLLLGSASCTNAKKIAGPTPRFPFPPVVVQPGSGILPTCYDCIWPKGYTGLPIPGERCVDKRIECTCSTPGTSPEQSLQGVCVYPIEPNSPFHDLALDPIMIQPVGPNK
jgi:hypothetical protein